MIRTSLRLILTALAAIVALTACTKEIAPGKADTEPKSPVAEGSRTIAVSFAPQTKTYLEGLQPKFNDGDSVLLVTMSEDKTAVQDTQTVAVTVDPSTESATITTTLQGNLRALYPAKLAELTGKGKWSILISEVQSGRFEDANICRADISADSKVASFRNMFPLLKITPPNETRKLTIKSLPKIGTDGQRTGETAHINSKGSNQYAVTVSGQILSMPDTAYFVALQPGASFENLSFEAWFDDGGTTGAVKGIVKEKLDIVREKDTTKNTGNIQAGWAYTINGTDWHEYVTVGGRKWATMNIGATSPEEPGEYFMWGYTVGHAANTTGMDAFSGQTFKQDEARGDDSKGFAWDNYIKFTSSTYSPTNKTVFTKYVPFDKAVTYGDGGTFYDDKTTLDLADDAANANWGGAWRMPTKAEFDALSDGSWDVSNKGYTFGTSHKIFLPAVDCGDGVDLENVGAYGYYWSSSLSGTNDNPYYAYCFNFLSNEAATYISFRCYGMPVRAIVDEPTIKEKDKKK